MEFPVDKVENPDFDQRLHETRDSALHTPMVLSIGLAMMQKMGFQPGQALGKGGITEPITVKVRHSRAGIGAPEAKPPKEVETNVEEFRDHLKQTLTAKKIAALVHKLQAVCFERSGDMDKVLSGEKVEANEMWQSYAEMFVERQKPKGRARLFGEDEAPDTSKIVKQRSSEGTADDLAVLLLFVRKEYFYCIFCGCTYSDAEDMKECPGPYEEDHENNE